MQHIHTAIREGGYPNCSRLGRELEVGRKTVLRDIAFMRDELRMPIGWDAVKNGYFYEASVSTFPPLRIGVEELMALFVARKVMAPIAGTAVERALSQAFQRLAALSGGDVRLSWQELDQAFSVHEPGGMDVDLALIEKLSTALVRHKKLFLRYRSARNQVSKARRVHPLHLSQFQGGWYLFGWDEGAKDIRIFALPRMEEVELLAEGFTPPRDFNLEDYLDGSMGLVTEPGAPLTTVRARFRGYAAVLVTERHWHTSQTTRREEDGSVVLTFRLRHLDDVRRWVLGWGGLAEVLEPESLRREVARSARQIAREHRTG